MSTRKIRVLVGKPGLDGHSNGAEQVAVRARDCGFHVVRRIRQRRHGAKITTRYREKDEVWLEFIEIG